MRVAVRIFHPGLPPGGGSLSVWLAETTRQLAERHRVGFLAAGAEDVAVVPGGGHRPFGARLRELGAELAGFDGLVVLGSGALALATLQDRRRFVDAARRPAHGLANNRYSADAVAIGGLAPLVAAPDLRTDNALPRWLAEVHGYAITDLRRRWRLGVDLDSPLDIVLAGLDRGRSAPPAPPDVALTTVHQRLAAVAQASADPARELLVAGRLSAGALVWLERRTRCRVRALVEERGLRAGSDGSWLSSELEGTTGRSPMRRGPGAPGQRPPASVLGALLDERGPRRFGEIVTRLADAALVDTRVLLAHRLGRDERSWPRPEDRYASDLLLPDRIADPWLRELTAAALAAPVPVVLGGHGLVGPGLRLALLTSRRPERPIAVRSDTSPDVARR